MRGADDGALPVDEPGCTLPPEPTAEEVASYRYNGHTVEIDDDAILPLMGSACRSWMTCCNVYGLLDVIWGEERGHQCQLFGGVPGCRWSVLPGQGFLQGPLQTVQKKPIYWLFASKRAFQVLVYMHRMNAFTVQKFDRYLLDHLRQLRLEIERLEGLRRPRPN